MTVKAPPGYAAIVTAAGRGTRAGGEPKQWRDLRGRSILARSLDAFARFDRVVLVVHPDDMARAIRDFAGGVTIVTGRDPRGQRHGGA